MTRIKQILENYYEYKAKSELCKRKNIEKGKISIVDDFNLICDCIELLEGEKQAVVENLYVKQMSLRKCSKELSMSHNTVARIRDKAIENIEEMVNFMP